MEEVLIRPYLPQTRSDRFNVGRGIHVREEARVVKTGPATENDRLQNR